MHPCPHPSFLHGIAQRPFDRRVGGVLFRRAGLLRLSGLLGSFALAFGHFKLLVKVRLSGGGPSLPGRARKRVVWGKSVSVRVDLGGRRIMKNKKVRRIGYVIYIREINR